MLRPRSGARDVRSPGLSIPILRASRDFAIHAFDDVEVVPDVSVEHRVDEVRVVVHGDLDLASGEQLRAIGERLIAKRPARVVVDLQRLELLGGSGVAVLELLTDTARRAGVGFDVAVAGNPQARRVIASHGTFAWLSPR